MMQCSNGHFYNPANGPCPHCSGSNHLQGKTVGYNPNQQGTNNNQIGSSPFPLPNKLGQVPINNHQEQPPHMVNNPASLDEGKTVGMFLKNEGIDPVVGWLVCIEGKDRGKDYRIHSDKNTIGRSDNNDITISGDQMISREGHANIVYDPKKKQFRLLSGSGRGLVYLNDEAVDFVSVLKANDTIEIGETKLMFVPFCGVAYDWE